jgi:hypothetical protein
MHPDKLKNVLNLSPQNRYGYFIRKVADTEQVWLLQEDGKYVTLGDREEQVTIPVFPEREFADLLSTDDWQGCVAIAMEVHDFIDWLEQLEEEGIQISGFPMHDLNAVVVNAEEMKNHLLYELQQYE